MSVYPLRSIIIFCVLYVLRLPVSTPMSKPLSTSVIRVIVVAESGVAGYAPVSTAAIASAKEL